MNIVSVSKKRVEVTYFRGSEKIMDIFSHMRVNGIYWSPFWEGDNFWGTETITFGWPLNTLSNPTKIRGIAQPPFFMTMSSTHFSLIDTVHFCRISI